MKWSDHKRITYYVCKNFGLDEKTAKKIADASILPDKHPDYIVVYGKKRTYRKRVPHHSIRGLRVGLSYLKEARKKYVKGQDFTVELGKALHYIQDYSISIMKNFLIFSWRDYNSHEVVEAEISSLSLSYDDVKKGFEEVVYPSQFEDVVLRNGSKRDPQEALKVATYLSALALKLVLKPDIPPNIELEYSKKLKRHVSFTLGGFAIATLLSLVYGLSLFASCFVGCVAGYILHKLDIPFHKVAFDRNWLLGK